MKNEFGQDLDRNGYGPQVIMWPEDRCFVCGRRDRPLQRHEVFHGPFRDKSMRYGCWIAVCYECHDKLHHGGALERGVKGAIQHMAMEKYNWNIDEWRLNFGKNYEDTVL